MDGRGYGKTIVQALEAHARGRGLSETWLSITLPSRGFYEGMGYEVYEDAHADIGEGEQFDYWNARKQLLDGES